MNKDKLNLDPRAGIFLLFILNFTIFNVSKTSALFLLLLWSCIYALYNGFYKISIKFVIVYLLFYGIEFFVLPKLPSLIAMSFAILLMYILKMLSVALFGYTFVKTTSLYELISALRKMRFPESIITGLSITLRYFPALKEDYAKTRDAMKLKNMSTIDKLNGLIITTITRATLNIEELSQAATVRGIDNPVKRNSIIELHFKRRDLLVCVISFAFYALVYFRY
ncbi:MULTISPECIES: energy-coupling factor transporter transmembrane component T [Bacillota]|uniref:energy-coupling factor transporter transmembrane component T n=1 Tax=Bacillota TaxID=1239 RepID=UPI0021D2DFBC|nr:MULTISPECIES: energy-coupling factor transporter transmembrane component T [Bacillota]MCU6007479.1 energy-coupling factor transporter transmembrane protein EcfT [Clostridioides difficile]